MPSKEVNGVHNATRTKNIERKSTSFNPVRQGGRLLSALNKAIGIGNPYCKKV